MDTYFDLIPKELTEVILNYIDAHEDFVNLYELTNSFESILSNKFFWIQYLKDRLDKFYELSPEFSSKMLDIKTLKFYYLSSHTFRILHAYKLAIDKYGKMVNEINKGIQEYYPNMTLNNIDHDLIERDTNNDNLLGEGIVTELPRNTVNDLSILYTPGNPFIKDLITLLNKIADGIRIQTIKLYMSYDHYSVIFDMPTKNFRFNVFILTEKQYIGFLIQSYFNGAEVIQF